MKAILIIFFASILGACTHTQQEPELVTFSSDADRYTLGNFLASHINPAKIKLAPGRVKMDTQIQPGNCLHQLASFINTMHQKGYKVSYGSNSFMILARAFKGNLQTKNLESKHFVMWQSHDQRFRVIPQDVKRVPCKLYNASFLAAGF